MRFRKVIIAALVLLFSVMQGKTQVAPCDFGSESLNYQIVYHWGLIWKHAANANLSINQVGDNYNAKLTARTISWAERFYPVRDTLSCVMAKKGLRPLVYEKATHEKKHYGFDRVSYSYSGTVVIGDCERFRPEKPKYEIKLYSQGPTYDMLSVFYYLRCFDFNKLDKSKYYVSTMFSGKRKEKLTVKYLGKEEIELRDKSKHNAHKISLLFTLDNGQKSSDGIEIWFSDDAKRIPLMLLGRLPIGEIRCYYAKNK